MAAMLRQNAAPTNIRPPAGGRQTIEIPMHDINQTLKALGLHDLNSGTWSGSHGWSTQTGGALIDSINPATNERIAQVRGATARLRGRPVAHALWQHHALRARAASHV
jgi:hypothetical protein